MQNQNEAYDNTVSFKKKKKKKTGTHSLFSLSHNPGTQ